MDTLALLTRGVTHVGCFQACTSDNLTLRCYLFCRVLHMLLPCFGESSSCPYVTVFTISGVNKLFQTENSGLPCVYVFYNEAN